jgi:hypothetical protein
MVTLETVPSALPSLVQIHNDLFFAFPSTKGRRTKDGEHCSAH